MLERSTWLQAQKAPFVFCSGYEHLEASPEYDRCARFRKPVDVGLLDDELRRVRVAA